MRRRDVLRRGALALPTLAIVAGTAHPACAAASDGTLQPVDVELVLAVDISGSIGPGEMELQFQGYAEAFRNPLLGRRIAAGALGAIACTLFVWHDPEEQEILLPWTRIDGIASARRFGDAIAQAPRYAGHGTSISAALDFALGQFGRGGFEGTRRVVDISGDGINNSARPGRSLAVVREEAIEQGVTVNGIAILDQDAAAARPWRMPVDRFYGESVIAGAGAFLVVADGFDAFASAIGRKLVREIAEAVPGAPPEERFRLA